MLNPLNFPRKRQNKNDGHSTGGIFEAHFKRDFLIRASKWQLHFNFNRRYIHNFKDMHAKYG